MRSAIRKALRNFHLPLPESTYEALREAAARAGKPTTTLAREAIEAWLNERRRAAVHESIATYALKHGGTPVDLDEDLEAASLELLRRRKPRR